VFITVAGVRPSQARGDTALLVAEIADSSLKFDLTVKADLYRDYGVREYWVVDVQARVTHVHKREGQAWGRVVAVPFEETLHPALVPGVALRLAEWG
jgi:Uma2 family endonuclease